MTEIRQEHHHPIAAGDARDVKPWRLPYWTEPPAWLAEKAAAEETEAVAADVHETDDVIPMPTAEELENIRREAYNAGLEQGLVEGRQQGHKEGYDNGHKEGYAAAFAEGKVEGHKEGVRSGEEEGRRKAQADVNAVVLRLQRVLNTLQAGIQERDQQLPEVLAALVAGICSRVLGHELNDGAVNILQFVQRALAELPGGEQHIQVVIGPDDARHLQNSLELTGTDMHFRVDDKLPAGACRIETEHSLVEYSSQDYLNQLLDTVLTQMMQQAVSFPDEDEQALYEVALAPETAPEPADVQQSEEQRAEATANEMPSADSRLEDTGDGNLPAQDAPMNTAADTVPETTINDASPDAVLPAENDADAPDSDGQELPHEPQ